MKQLILFEGKKIIRNKLFLVILLLALLLNAATIYNDRDKVPKHFFDARLSMYQKVRGEITQKKYDFIDDHYQGAKKIVDGGTYDTKASSSKYYTGFVFGDMNLFHEFLTGYNYDIDYNQKLSDALQIAHQNLNIYTKAEDISLNKKFIQSFENRGLGYYYNTQNMTNFLSHDFSTFLIIILLIIVLSSVFSEDIEYNYYQILYPTQGRKRLYISQIMMAVIVTLIFCILFFLEDFLIYK